MIRKTVYFALLIIILTTCQRRNFKYTNPPINTPKDNYLKKEKPVESSPIPQKRKPKSPKPVTEFKRPPKGEFNETSSAREEKDAGNGIKVLGPINARRYKLAPLEYHFPAFQKEVDSPLMRAIHLDIEYKGCHKYLVFLELHNEDEDRIGSEILYSDEKREYFLQVDAHKSVTLSLRSRKKGFNSDGFGRHMNKEECFLNIQPPISKVFPLKQEKVLSSQSIDFEENEFPYDGLDCKPDAFEHKKCKLKQFQLELLELSPSQPTEQVTEVIEVKIHYKGCRYIRVFLELLGPEEKLIERQLLYPGEERNYSFDLKGRKVTGLKLSTKDKDFGVGKFGRVMKTCELKIEQPVYKVISNQ